MELTPYHGSWEPSDPHANFKADVALYSKIDPLPTFEGLSRATGVPVECLLRYVAVKYAASGAEARLLMRPIVLRQMEEHIAKAEAANTDEARLEAYEALKQMVGWLKSGEK